jgi:hypothetical protein
MLRKSPRECPAGARPVNTPEQLAICLDDVLQAVGLSGSFDTDGYFASTQGPLRKRIVTRLMGQMIYCADPRQGQNKDIPSMSEDAKAKIEALEKEIERLRRSASEEAAKKAAAQPPVVAAAVTLPPPSTYAEAVRREFNRAKHAEARADKINRAKMARVSKDAAAIKAEEKERALREKFKEGYVPLALRQQQRKLASEAKAKTTASTVKQKAAQVAHTFVRFTRKQMREHQSAVLKATGAEKWFSAAERAAYKALPPSAKANIKAARMLRAQKAEEEKAAEREKFRKERNERVLALTRARVEALAKSTPKQRFKGKGKAAAQKKCQVPCRLVTNATGTGTSCRDCGCAGTTE